MSSAYTLTRVAAVIVTYNRLEKLRRMLHNTLAQPFFKIIVVNNASTDGIKAYLDNLALQLRFSLSSETIDNYDSGYDD